jgi:hypothetical protein
MGSLLAALSSQELARRVPRRTPPHALRLADRAGKLAAQYCPNHKNTMSYASGRHFLQIPGPTNVPDRVLRRAETGLQNA